MKPGDLVLTPNWTWHDHYNAGEKNLVWLDVLDAHLTRHLDAGFQENYAEAPAQPIVRREGYCRQRYGTIRPRAAQRPRAEGLMTFLSERKIHRLLIKPSAPGITRLLIESAVKRCLQLRELKEAGADLGERRFPSPRETKRVPAWVFPSVGAALLVVVGLVIALGSWFRGPLTDGAAGGTATQAGAGAPRSTCSPPSGVRAGSRHGCACPAA